MRRFFDFLPSGRKQFVARLLVWADKNDCFCLLNHDEAESETSQYMGFKFIAGFRAASEIKSYSFSDNNFQLFYDFVEANNNLLMGFLGYDLKNQTEKLCSENNDSLAMPQMHFFQPEITFEFSDDGEIIRVSYLDEKISAEKIRNICADIDNSKVDDETERNEEVVISSKVSKDEYLENVKKIKEHIQVGDVYELNYCIEFFAENVEINPVQVYKKLNRISPAPFSCFYKVDNKYLICASPERFMKKEGKKIVSQPMKGTAGRSADETEDQLIKHNLFSSEKEQAENVMIVDLVRNDLSKTAVHKSVKVDELFGVYSFPQVHQMISTVSSEMRADATVTDVIKSAFPMGSMTGAPKVKAMELIEEFETTKRGLFSGAVGYISPEKNFDFNVVIRSIQYNTENKYLSFMVGSAITINSDPEKEYEECLLKAKALIDALK